MPDTAPAPSTPRSTPPSMLAAMPPSPLPAAPTDAATVQRVVEFFETLTPDSVARFGELYTPDVWFKDPFNEVRGLAEVQRIFSHMYVTLHDPHFVITSRVIDGPRCFLTWDFKFRFKRFATGVQQTVRGGSHLKFAPGPDGLPRIAYHRDYWDAAEELYEKLPLVGALMRWLKRRANS